jgi:hypothetical protein
VHPALGGEVGRLPTLTVQPTSPRPSPALNTSSDDNRALHGPEDDAAGNIRHRHDITGQSGMRTPARAPANRGNRSSSQLSRHIGAGRGTQQYPRGSKSSSLDENIDPALGQTGFDGTASWRC